MFGGVKSNVAAVLPMMWTPGISAILTSAIFKDYLGDYGWKPGKVRFLAYAYWLPLIVSTVCYGFGWLAATLSFPQQK
jgi:hypothetical protein